MKIKNLYNDTTFFLEPGRILSSLDSTRQDILVIRQEVLTLAQNAEKELKIFGFCAQSSNGAPQKDDKYFPGYIANDTIVALAQYLNNNRYDLAVMQSAVWVMVNNHAVSSIVKGEKNENSPLIKFVSKLKGIEIPWYSITYLEDTALVFTNKPKLLMADFKYEIWENCFASLSIFNESDHLVRQLFDKKPHNPDKHSFSFTVDLTKLPRGKYKVMLYTDSQQKTIKYFNF